MRRVVITGLGIVSSIGTGPEEVTASLREARSGVVFSPEYAALGFRCQVNAPVKPMPMWPWSRRSPTPV